MRQGQGLDAPPRLLGRRDRVVPGAERQQDGELLASVAGHELAGAPHWLFWGDFEGKVGDHLAAWLERLPA